MNILQKIVGFKTESQTYSLSATKDERNNLCTEIISSSSPRIGFYLLLILSTLIVVSGLLKDSIVLVIGGMLVAPLLSPILSISLAITIFKGKVFLRSILVFIISALASLLTAMIIGLIADFDLATMELVEMMHIFDAATILVPIAAGAAASFTWAKKDLNSSLSGVAVTVTLLPPLAVMGLALAQQNLIIFQDSLNLYFLNVSGIIIGSLIIFLLMGFYKSGKKVVEQVDLESKSNN